ncbi:MAG TPA: hypothetical protein VGV37_15620 [Aliidongia sp.]|uniref:hypothetical protein n=1 Tax=Aliidongia sp. TaxID=1914230 RepID=UPI002DDDB549|nr:hypothetical protein [Aliidongia sp.]HEV2675950.1 hypothetical protein [Aliidongia sp.]
MTSQLDTDPQAFLGAVISPAVRRVGARRRAEPATLLDNAGHLLRYAVEAGIDVDADTSQRIIQARIEGDSAWNCAEAGRLASAIIKLAALVHPVTAETLRACREQAYTTIRNYRGMACALAVIILPLSMISFVYTGLSNAVTADLAVANQLAVNLHAQLNTSGAPTASTAALNSLPDLQQYAATIRSIRARTKQLAWFVPVEFEFREGPADGKGRLELDPSLSNSVPELVNNLNRLTAAYQNVRSDAKSVQDAASLLYGAISACILPVLYALLGACAYLLRVFSEQVASQTFRPTYAASARFVIAAIGGAIVGLFNNFSIGQGASLSPLAVAFLVGYAADIFFSFLEGSLQNFRKSKAP